MALIDCKVVSYLDLDTLRLTPPVALRHDEAVAGKPGHVTLITVFNDEEYIVQTDIYDVNGHTLSSASPGCVWGRTTDSTLSYFEG